MISCYPRSFPDKPRSTRLNRDTVVFEAVLISKRVSWRVRRVDNTQYSRVPTGSWQKSVTSRAGHRLTHQYWLHCCGKNQSVYWTAAVYWSSEASNAERSEWPSSAERSSAPAREGAPLEAPPEAPKEDLIHSTPMYSTTLRIRTAAESSSRSVVCWSFLPGTTDAYELMVLCAVSFKLAFLLKLNC